MRFLSISYSNELVNLMFSRTHINFNDYSRMNVVECRQRQTVYSDSATAVAATAAVTTDFMTGSGRYMCAGSSINLSI